MVIAALMMARILLIRLTLEAAGFRLSSSTLVNRVQYSQQGYHVFRRERSYLIVCVMSLPSLGCATDGFKGWCLERVLPACRLALQLLMVKLRRPLGKRSRAAESATLLRVAL